MDRDDSLREDLVDEAREDDAALTEPESFSPRGYRVAWVIAAVVLVIAIGWTRFEIGGARTTQVFTDSMVALGATAAAVALTRLARRVTGRSSRGWTLLAAGAWFEALGELTWTGYVVLAGSAPYPDLPDVFYLAGYPLLAAGFLSLAADPDRPTQGVRLLLDGLVVGTALLAIGWHFVLEAILAASTLGSFATWVSLAYPIADILVGSIAFVVAVNARGRRRVPLLLVAIGILVWAFGDAAFAYVEFTGTPGYEDIALSWLVGDLLIALGALHPNASRAPPTEERTTYALHELLSPFVPFLLALGLLGVEGVRGALDGYDYALGGLVILALVARQTYVLSDATRISRDLEESEAVLARRNHELVLVNRIVRHDIRNDMAVAYGWAGELEAHVDEAGRKMLDRILATTQHTIDLTETLRDFVAALEPGGEPELRPTPLRSTILDTLASRRETYPHASFVVDDEIPDVEVCANPLLDTVFRNLLNNAVQHADHDEPHVEVQATGTDDTVHVRIADDGPGIPDDRKETVFGRGQTGLDSAGSGVGLYLVHTLVTQYGGDVWVEDNDPRGAVFVVELDRVERPT